MPYYYVQLSSIDTIKYKGQLWPSFRDEQRKILQKITHSGMAVSSDIGAKDDVHPTNKKEVGQRLARWALHKTYGVSLIPSGPLPKKARFKGGNIIVTFRYAAGGLTTADGKPVRGFTLDGQQETAVRIKKNKILIEAAQKPQIIFYGWQPYTEANLINPEKLPASTFSIKVR